MQRGRLVHYTCTYIRMTGNVNKEMKCNVLGNIPGKDAQPYPRRNERPYSSGERRFVECVANACLVAPYVAVEQLVTCAIITFLGPRWFTRPYPYPLSWRLDRSPSCARAHFHLSAGPHHKTLSPERGKWEYFLPEPSWRFVSTCPAPWQILSTHSLRSVLLDNVGFPLPTLRRLAWSAKYQTESVARSRLSHCQARIDARCVDPIVRARKVESTVENVVLKLLVKIARRVNELACRA